MSPSEFWQLTPVEFDRLTRGFERQRTEAWRHTRLQCVILLNVNRDPKTAAISPEEWMPLPGDPPPTPPMSEAEFDDTMARLAAFDNLQAAA